MEQIKDKLFTNKYFRFGKNYLEKLYNYLISEEGLRDLAMFPLFFNWIPFLILKSENIVIRKSSIYSMLFSLYFFICLILSLIANMLPFIGYILANLFHTVGIIAYLGLTGFFIYSYHRNKTLDLAVIDRHYDFLVKNLF